MVSAVILCVPKSNILKSTYMYIMPIVRIEAFQCTRCKHIWMPRHGVKEKPKVCPSCKSPYWDIPRRSRGKRKIL